MGPQGTLNVVAKFEGRIELGIDLLRRECAAETTP